MKRFLMASSVAFALASVSAFAADMPLKASSPVAGWTGCYLDGGVGYGMWDQTHNEEGFPSLVATTSSSNTAGQGWLGRVGGGCDYQLSAFVVGAFADYDFMNLHGTFANGFASAAGGSETESGAWAVGGRVGYLVNPVLLTYVDGGFTEAKFGQVNLGNLATGAAPNNFLSATVYNGWFIGGGTEYSLAGIVPISGLFWRTEYRYATYSAADVQGFVIATGASAGFAEHIQPSVQTITSGLVWRFDFSGPFASRD
jgi:outer membrane immunogenic protein